MSDQPTDQPDSSGTLSQAPATTAPADGTSVTTGASTSASDPSTTSTSTSTSVDPAPAPTPVSPLGSSTPATTAPAPSTSSTSSTPPAAVDSSSSTPASSTTSSTSSSTGPAVGDVVSWTSYDDFENPHTAYGLVLTLDDADGAGGKPVRLARVFPLGAGALVLDVDDLDD